MIVFRLHHFFHRHRVHVCLAPAAAAMLWACWCATTAAAQPAAVVDREDVARACTRGLEWLAAAQQPDGSWGSGPFRGSVAVTAQAILSLVAAGNTAVSGPRSESVARGVGYLVASAGPDGLIQGNEQAAHGPMYGHAFATLALAELYGETTDDETIAPILDRARGVIEASQNEEGGWRYQPLRRDADASVTAGMIVALRGLQNSGFEVSAPTVDRGVAYLLRLQNPDGGFRYQSAAGPGGSARTAASLFALIAAGVGEGDAIDRGFAWLADHPVRLGRPGGKQADDGYAMYGLAASAAAIWRRGGGAWDAWYAVAAADLLGAQQADGSWRDPSCPEYGTIAALSVLQMPDDLTPLFQRERTTP